MAVLPLEFIPATPDHHARILALLRDRAGWIAAQGRRQWAIFLTDRADALVSDLIATSYTYLVTSNGSDVGTLRLQWADRRFWGDAGEDGTAGYVHTLATHRAFAGNRLAARMLEWASNRIIDEGRSLLRIDCDATCPKLIGYYLSLGFEKREIVQMDTIDPGYRSQLLERSALTAFG